MNKALVINPERCTGCHSCEMACSLVHDQECNPSLSRIGIMKSNGGGTTENIPMVCQQCSDPFCAYVCITGAISRNDETGAIVVNEELCVGCKICVVACPLGGILYHSRKERSVKCDLCQGDPACVKSCCYGALEYLSMDDWGRKKRLRGAENLSRLLHVIYK